MIQGSFKISFADYLADPAPEPSLSRGTIIDLLDSPARAWWNHPRLNPNPPEEKEKTIFDIGEAAHNLLLEGGGSIFVVEGYDDWKKKDAQEARKAAREMGKTPLLSKQYEMALEMGVVAVRAIQGCTELGITDLRAEGDSELSYLWQESDVWCRCRPDWIKKDRSLILDIKTTGTSVNPDIFSGHINKMGYGIQSVFYRRGVRVVDGVEGWSGPKFVIMAQETEPPYFCSFHGLDLQNEDMAVQKVNWAIKRWRECLSTGEWPAYPHRVCYAEPKPWEMAEWELKRYQIGGDDGIRI
jgi:hypothetical protein